MDNLNIIFTSSSSPDLIKFLYSKILEMSDEDHILSADTIQKKYNISREWATDILLNSVENTIKDQSTKIFFAIKENKPIGFAVCIKASLEDVEEFDTNNEIYAFFIKKEYRNTGIGEIFLRFVFNELEKPVLIRCYEKSEAMQHLLLHKFLAKIVRVEKLTYGPVVMYFKI